MKTSLALGPGPRAGFSRRPLALLALALCGLAAVALAATTYTAPPPQSSRSDWMTNRYALPQEGLLVVKVTTATVADQSITLDSNLAGYLQRVVATHNGNDASWTLTVTATADGAAIFSQTCNATDDPNSFLANYGTGGIPFAGGLTVSVAGADGGTGDVITVWLYVREAWRR
jgi:hypothetical protein